MKNLEPNFSKNQKCLLRIQKINIPKMKSTKYFVEITQKAEKYLEASERKTTCLLVCLPDTSTKPQNLSHMV